MTLQRKTIANNDDRDIPREIVNAHEYVRHLDDNF
jgi:hypothetical protein